MSIRETSLQKITSNFKRTWLAAIFFLSVCIYGFITSNLVIQFFSIISLILLVIGLIKQKNAMIIIKDGALLDFEIIGSFEYYGSGGIRHYHPIVIDPETKLQIRAKELSHIGFYLKGGKIIGFRKGDKYWFVSELENLVVENIELNKK